MTEKHHLLLVASRMLRSSDGEDSRDDRMHQENRFHPRVHG